MGSEDIEDEVREGFVGNEEGFVVEVDGEVVGTIQYGEEDDPMYRHANMDIFLATARHGRGLGTEAIRVLARYLFEGRGHHRLTIDPASDNAPAVRTYEKVGFREVGVIHRYERGLRSNRARVIYRALGVRKEEVERGQAWQSFIETNFNLQRRLADFHFERAES